MFRSVAAELMHFAQPLCPPCMASHFAQPLQFGSMSHVLCQPPALLFLSVIRLVRGSAGSFLPPAKAVEPARAMASDNAAIAILEFMVRYLPGYNTAFPVLSGCYNKKNIKEIFSEIKLLHFFQVDAPIRWPANNFITPSDRIKFSFYSDL